jgi:hypothetical protein
MMSWLRRIAAILGVLALVGVSHAAAPPVALLTHVRVSTAAGVDRVSFTFRSPPRAVRVLFRPRSALVAESGRGVPVAGSAFLVAVVRPASGVDLSGAAPVVTYRGAKRIRPTVARHVREVAELGDFEAVLRWAIGLDTRRPFTVSRTGSSVVLTIR